MEELGRFRGVNLLDGVLPTEVFRRASFVGGSHGRGGVGAKGRNERVWATYLCLAVLLGAALSLRVSHAPVNQAWYEPNGVVSQAPPPCIVQASSQNASSLNFTSYHFTSRTSHATTPPQVRTPQVARHLPHVIQLRFTRHKLGPPCTSSKFASHSPQVSSRSNFKLQAPSL